MLGDEEEDGEVFLKWGRAGRRPEGQSLVLL